MNILHYSLGFPPYRTGGMTKFCIDLMQQQIRDTNEVELLWPGQIGFIKKSMRIKCRGNVKLDAFDIRSYEIINPLPVPYDEGVKRFSEYVLSGDKEVYRSFLKKIKPNVIHIHTLMGLHKEFLEVAKELSIRCVFTAHDFYPICPKVTMFRQGKICETIRECTDCGKCNATALDLNKIRLLQSPLYRHLKDVNVIKKIRKRHRDMYLGEKSENNKKVSTGDPKDFKALRAYYESMLKMMTIIHYNSSITKNVYQLYFSSFPNCVIGISHSDIINRKRVKNYNRDNIRIRYLGPQSGAKGYFYLKNTLDKVWNVRKDFILDVHFIPIKMEDYIRCNGRYTYLELEEIFDKTDVLIAPSVWFETFGYTVLEALSYGVPVIVTKNVGAKDIVVDGCGIIVDDEGGRNLYEVLKNLTLDDLKEMNYKIVNNQSILSLKEMTNSIYEKCY